MVQAANGDAGVQEIPVGDTDWEYLYRGKNWNPEAGRSVGCVGGKQKEEEGRERSPRKTSVCGGTAS